MRNPVQADEYEHPCPSAAELQARLPGGRVLCGAPAAGCGHVSVHACRGPCMWRQGKLAVVHALQLQCCSTLPNSKPKLKPRCAVLPLLSHRACSAWTPARASASRSSTPRPTATAWTPAATAACPRCVDSPEAPGGQGLQGSEPRLQAEALRTMHASSLCPSALLGALRRCGTPPLGCSSARPATPSIPPLRPPGRPTRASPLARPPAVSCC